MATNVADNIGEARENVTGWWNRSRTFLTEVRNELKRVTWPSQKEVYATTVVVGWGNTGETRRILLTDAQTSGGLLLCVAEAKLEKVQKILENIRAPSAAVIGRIVPRRRRRPLICMTN